LFGLGGLSDPKYVSNTLLSGIAGVADGDRDRAAACTGFWRRSRRIWSWIQWYGQNPTTGRLASGKTLKAEDNVEIVRTVGVFDNNCCNCRIYCFDECRALLCLQGLINKSGRNRRLCGSRVRCSGWAAGASCKVSLLGLLRFEACAGISRGGLQ
jgi:hypothetical protein